MLIDAQGKSWQFYSGAVALLLKILFLSCRMSLCPQIPSKPGILIILQSLLNIFPRLKLVQRDFNALNITDIGYVTAKSLLSSNCLFNQGMVQRAFLLFQKGDLDNFAKNFSDTDSRIFSCLFTGNKQ